MLTARRLALVAIAGLLAYPACDKGAAPPAASSSKPTAGATDKAPEPKGEAAVKPAATAKAPVEAPKAASTAAADKGKPGGTSIRLKEIPGAGKAETSDGKSLGDAKRLVDGMARELKRSTAAVVMAGKDKSKVEAIGADFKKLNKTMTEQMEAISERLTPTELAEFETYTRTKLSPLINQLLQTFFSAGGFQSAGGGPNGSTRLAPKTQPSTPVTSPTPAAAPTLTPKAAPVASALGAGATGAAAPAPTRASPTTPASGGESVQLVVAKAAVDSMAKELTGIVERIRTSNNDPATIRSINEDYKRVNQKHASGIPKLVEVLDAQQKATFSEYLKSRLMPVSNELVQAFTAAGALPNQ